MDEHGFVRLALLAFGLVFLSFIVLGTSQLLVPLRIAQYLAAPIGIAGFVLAIFCFLRATAAFVGLAPIETPPDDS